MTTTFFMDGCVSNNEEAVKYFDSIYFPVQDMIELDNGFQESMKDLIVASDQIVNEEDSIIDEDDYQESLQKVEEAYNDLSRFVNSKEKEIREISIYHNETALQRSAIALFQAYHKVLDTDFREMLELLKMDNPTEESNKRFNTLLKHSNSILDKNLEEFYETSTDYGERYNIDLEFDED